jgi:hypothetical protein
VKSGDWTGCVDRIWCEGFSFFLKTGAKVLLITTAAKDCLNSHSTNSFICKLLLLESECTSKRFIQSHSGQCVQEGARVLVWK